MIITKERLAQLIDEEIDNVAKARRHRVTEESNPLGSDLVEDDEMDEAEGTWNQHKVNQDREHESPDVDDEEDPVEIVANETTYVFYKELKKNFSVQQLRPGTIDDMTKRLNEFVSELVKELDR